MPPRKRGLRGKSGVTKTRPIDSNGTEQRADDTVMAGRKDEKVAGMEAGADVKVDMEMEMEMEEGEEEDDFPDKIQSIYCTPLCLI